VVRSVVEKKKEKEMAWLGLAWEVGGRRSWPLGMDFPMANPAFNFSLILFLLALGIEVPLLG